MTAAEALLSFEDTPAAHKLLTEHLKYLPEETMEVIKLVWIDSTRQLVLEYRTPPHPNAVRLTFRG